MRLELRLPRTRFVANEEISVQVALTNDGPDPVECPDPFHAFNWQPRYTLTGPQYPDGRSFSFRSAVRNDPRPNPADATPVLVQVAPGETLESDIPLSEWVPFQAPGKYRLEARLEWGAVRADAPAVELELGAAEVTAMSLGVDAGVRSASEAWVGWLSDGPQGSALGEALFREEYGDPVGMKRLHMQSVRAVGASAAEVLAPCANYDRKAALTFWRAWREGARLLAAEAAATEPVELDLGPRAMVLPPALMTEAGELDVFVLTPQTGALRLARFSPGQAPRFLEGAVLPGKILGARAALGTAAQGSPRHLAAVTADQAGRTALHHVGAGDGSRWAPPRSVPLPATRWAVQSTPAVRPRVDGRVDVALLCFMDDGEGGRPPGPDAPPVLAVVEVTFPAGPERVQPLVTPIRRLPAPPRFACASYAITPGGPERLDWAVLLEEGGLVDSFSPQELRRPAAPPAEPLEILSLDRNAYLLVSAPSGPEFELLY